MFPTPQVFSLVYAYRRKNECNLTQFIYVVNFNSMTLSDGSILASSCRITLEIDNNTFMTPDSYPVKVPNEEVALNIRAMDPQLAVGLATATAFLLIVAVMGTGGAGAAAGAVAVYLFLG
jgi:hypothetical protein